MAERLDQGTTVIASGVDAIIATLVDGSTSPTVSQAAGIPLARVDVEPATLVPLPASEARVGPNEGEPGTLGAREVCCLMEPTGPEAAPGRIRIGDLAFRPVRRTGDDRDRRAAEEGCGVVIVADASVGDGLHDGARIVTASAPSSS